MVIPQQPITGGDIDFAYANSILAIMEREMISQGKLEQMKAADSLKDFTRTLSDTPYNLYFEQNIGINELVAQETNKTKEILYEILPNKVKWFFDIYYKKYDYNNLKMVLKSYFMGNPYPKDDMSTSGNFTPDELINYFKEERANELPFEFDYDKLSEQFEKSKELRCIDAVLDKAYYSEYLKAAKELNDDFFISFIKSQIDIKNILIFIRITRTGLPMEDYLLEGGYIPVNEFTKYTGQSTDVILSDIEFSQYIPLIQEGILALEKTGSYSFLETSVQNYFIDLLKEVKDIVFTVKPFIAYLLAKEHEVLLIKKTYIHVLNNIEFSAERDIVYV